MLCVLKKVRKVSFSAVFAHDRPELELDLTLATSGTLDISRKVQRVDYTHTHTHTTASLVDSRCNTRVIILF